MSDCTDCGEPATCTFDLGEDYAWWTGQPRYEPVCADCFKERDNYEPPDPDGEELFRDYQAEQREQMDKAWRLK